jgi:hypothetical protein
MRVGPVCTTDRKLEPERETMFSSVSLPRLPPQTTHGQLIRDTQAYQDLSHMAQPPLPPQTKVDSLIDSKPHYFQLPLPLCVSDVALVLAADKEGR